jgi:tRNA(Ile)-lysidine synthase
MLVAAVQAYIEMHSMLFPGARVIVAVSGGPDSMALLSVLHLLRTSYNLTLIVAHVNHQLRGKEACRDAAFVKQQAVRLGLSFHETQVDVKALQHASGLSPQHAARELRYEFFLSLQRTLDATHIALGHTADDQAETLLVRLLRGGGPAALAGIPAVRQPFIRPLMATSRQAILDYLQVERIPWVYDSSNAHRTYLRNRVRLDLLPILQQYNPQVIRRFTELADMLRADNEILERQTDVLVEQAVHWRSAKRVRVKRHPYCVAPVAIQRRLLRRLVDRLHTAPDTTSFQHVEGLRRFIIEGAVGKRFSLPGQLLAEHHRDFILLWSPRKLPATSRTLLLPVAGEVKLPELDLRLVTDVVDYNPYLLERETKWVYTDLERLRLPLQVRFPQPGDRFHPLGAPGQKKLQDFFTDSKLPRADRPFIPLVVSGTDVAWVVGYRIAEPFKVRAETRRVLRLRCETVEGNSL